MTGLPLEAGILDTRDRVLSSALQDEHYGLGKENAVFECWQISIWESVQYFTNSQSTK